MSRPVSNARPIRRRALQTALAALCALALLPGLARAGAYTYGAGAGTQRTVNAGILLLDPNIVGDMANSNSGATNVYPSGQGSDDKDPYVFYILNQRTDVKPFGWNIINPLAPSAVTSTVYQRWLNRTPTSKRPTYDLGQTLTPAMAGYWEVPLETTVSADLSKFDVLFLNINRAPVFTAADSEKLRRFVDGGGTLWVENSDSTGASTTFVTGLFFNLAYRTGGTGSAYVPAFIRPALISVPYQLSEAELNTLGDKHIGGYYADDANGNNPQDNSGRLTFATIVGNSGNGNRPVIAQASYGAGKIVVTTTGSANAINQYAGGVDVGDGGNSGPFCGINTQLAPTADLKLVADIIASTGSHDNEHQNGHQTGNDVGSLPSAVQTWSVPARANGIPAGAVISGHVAYAVVGGSLTAFDLYPAEDLDGNGDPDDGKPDFDNGLPYDVIWSVALGGPASAPTVGFDKNQKAAVLVELADGGVRAYDADTGGTTTGFGTGLLAGSGGRGTYLASMPIPAPTLYAGRVYAGGQDGTLYVYDAVAGINNNYQVDPAAATGTPYPVLAAPTVGLIPGDSTGKVPTNDIVALCVTQQGLFSVFLGSRGELLTQPVPSTANYNTKLLSLTGSKMDTGGAQRSYNLDYPDNEAVTSTATANPTAPFFTGGTGTGPLYADYDVDFTATPVNLTRTYAGASASSVVTGTAYTSVISAPALDRFGNVYYTVTDANGSTLVSVHDGPTQNRIHMNWRFLLPTVSPGLDADGTNYDFLLGYQFTTTANGVTAPSAPVVDAQGNVYVLASKGGTATTSGTAAILSFNTRNATVSADALAVPGQAGGITSVAITQPLPGGTGSEFPGVDPTTLAANQYTLNPSGHIEFTDFAQRSGGASPGTANLYPNLNEPYPITVGFTTGGVATTQNQNVRPLHTNLSWYTVLPNLAASGVTLVGGTLYFVDGVGGLNSVPADPTGAGFTVTNKFVSSATAPGAPSLVTSLGDSGVGATAAVPSTSNGALLVNGPNGLTAYTNQVTLVVDASRVLEMNASGDAEWAVDSTSKTTLAGDTTPIYNNGTTGTATGQYVTTTLELNRPTSLTELTANDYLVADTGNNRCVRFDRGGKVLWELTKFSDPTGLLKPGEPDTLNQPTSVQITSTYDNDTTSPTYGQTTVRYLISDTGNYRIVEIDDIYDKNLQFITDKNGNVIGNHVLRWTSHTHDVQGREYRYQSASYYASPVSGKFYVVALITNKRLAPFTYVPSAKSFGAAAPGNLAAANQDAAGGTIVLLDYDTAPGHQYGGALFGFNNQADGFIGIDPNSSNLIAVSTIKAYLTANGNFDLSTTLTPTATSTLQTLYIRNPRYMKVVTKQQIVKNGAGMTTQSVRHYLLADDNGVWDLDGNSFTAQFGFTQADYRNVTTPISQDGVSGATLTSGAGTNTAQVPFDRKLVPFVPTAIQLTGTDLVGGATVGRYLITNSYSQGEAANRTGDFGTVYNPIGTAPSVLPIPGFGGEVFEVHVVSSGTTTAYRETHDDPNGLPVIPSTNGIQRYTGHTISRPTGTNTSPLSQPMFAYRLQF